MALPAGRRPHLYRVFTAAMGKPPGRRHPSQSAPAEKPDRRERYRAREAAAGWTRCIVRCHIDDVPKIKAFASALIEERASRKTTPPEKTGGKRSR